MVHNKICDKDVVVSAQGNNLEEEKVRIETDVDDVFEQVDNEDDKV